MMENEYPKRITDVNKFFRDKGLGHIRLVRGKGYFYFALDGVDDRGILLNRYPTTSVYIYRLEDLTLEQWYDEFLELQKRAVSEITGDD